MILTASVIVGEARGTPSDCADADRASGHEENVLVSVFAVLVSVSASGTAGVHVVSGTLSVTWSVCASALDARVKPSENACARGRTVTAAAWEGPEWAGVHQQQ